MKRIAIYELEKTDEGYVIELTASEKKEIFANIEDLRKYVEDLMIKVYEDDYSEGLRDTFLEIIDINLGIVDEDMQDDEFAQTMHLCDLRSIWEKYHMMML